MTPVRDAIERARLHIDTARALLEHPPDPILGPSEIPEVVFDEQARDQASANISAWKVVSAATLR